MIQAKRDTDRSFLLAERSVVVSCRFVLDELPAFEVSLDRFLLFSYTGFRNMIGGAYALHKKN